MLNQWLNGKTIALKNHVGNWQEALKFVARPLLEQKIITLEYLDAIYQQHQRLGPYYVIAPKIAMPHARPEDGALALGLSLLVIKNGVNFGSADHDPVHLIVMLAAPDSHKHIDMLAHLAELFSSTESVEAIIAATGTEHIQAIINRFS